MSYEDYIYHILSYFNQILSENDQIEYEIYNEYEIVQFRVYLYDTENENAYERIYNLLQEGAFASEFEVCYYKNKLNNYEIITFVLNIKLEDLELFIDYDLKHYG